MRFRASLPTGLLLLLSLSCGSSHSSSPAPGDVEMLWHFTDGNTCSTLINMVAEMQVTIPGEAIQNNGAFPCNVGGTDGIQLRDFVPGTYSYSVSALASDGTVLYSAAGTFVVDGDVQVDVLLMPAISGASSTNQPGGS
jgi:hypothetical protein